MVKKLILPKFFLMMIVSSWLFASCQAPMLSTHGTASNSSSSTQTETPIKTPDLLPSLSNSVVPTVKESPQLGYQLTYISDCDNNPQCMFATDISCLECTSLVIGKPQILFQVSGVSVGEDGPGFPVTSSSWSPNGKQVVLEGTGKNNKGDIFVGDWLGKKWVNLTDGPKNESYPVWAPNGEEIAYLANSDDPNYWSQVFVISPNGQNQHQLMQVDQLNYIDQFTWHPNGRQMIFTMSDKQLFEQLFIADINGNNIQQLTDQTEDHRDPQVSPDGKWVVFRKDLNKGGKISNLYVIRTDGTGEHALTNDVTTWKVEPSWSPNGKWIAYFEKNNEQSDVILIRSDGTGRIRVTNNSGSKFGLAWRNYQ